MLLILWLLTIGGQPALSEDKSFEESMADVDYQVFVTMGFEAIKAKFNFPQDRFLIYGVPVEVGVAVSQIKNVFEDLNRRRITLIEQGQFDMVLETEFSASDLVELELYLNLLSQHLKESPPNTSADSKYIIKIIYKMVNISGLLALAHYNGLKGVDFDLIETYEQKLKEAAFKYLSLLDFAIEKIPGFVEEYRSYHSHARWLELHDLRHTPEYNLYMGRNCAALLVNGERVKRQIH